MQPERLPFADRLKRMRARLQLWSVGALLFLNMKNIRYLTGFTGSDGSLYIDQNCGILMVDGRYITQACDEASCFEVCQYLNKMDGIVDVLLKHGCGIVGFEAETMTVAIWSDLQTRLPSVTFRPLRQEIEALRCVKSDVEVEKIRTAAEIASQSLNAIFERIGSGLTEREIAAELDFAIRRNGAEDVSFPTIVASGDHSARPHARPQNREIHAGDLVTIDFGAIFDGYHSDETCTFALGRADAKQAKVYHIVKEAHDRAIKAIQAGVPCREIDARARNWINEQGFGEFFIHGTGHGVGLEVHEYPRIAAQSGTILETGMVVTVEPGVYLPGLWGVRIEDLVLVKENGYEVLSKYPKDFRIIDIK